MSTFKSHFKFNKQERSGIFFLLLLIVLIQILYYFFSSFETQVFENQLTLNQEIQDQITILKQNALKKDTLKLYPFNPNFITDYKGYQLGMSLEEIDRLHSFRANNKYVNTIEEFQKITLTSDSLLQLISPYFKFPEWIVTNKKEQLYKPEKIIKKITEIEINDLNTVTINELKTIKGIGDKLSARIIKFRDRLGGFIDDDQLYDVYGLDVEVVQRVFEKYKVLTKPKISKININTASVDDIAKIVYIQKRVAQRIVEYRNSNKSILSFDELLEIEEFPVDKIDRIKLYLSL
tara:strand:- start:1137 stop:2012 length:876 start_codon:yes stop_codon:yes gene_type:complete